MTLTQQRRNGYGGTRREPKSSPPAASALGWAEIVVSEASAGAGKLSVRLPGGASLELDGSRESLRLAAELLRELECAGVNRGGVTC